jgi:deoxyribonuclease-1
MKSIITSTLTLISIFCAPLTYAEHPKSFQEAKKQAKVIFSDMRKTFYCDCKFDKQLNVDLNSCDYVPRKNKKRASRVEWEHIVPAENFGKGMQSKCWIEPICEKKNGKSYKGRSCCLKVDEDFQKMHNDLHNLVPAIGEVNGDRSNFRFSTLESSDYTYGNCNFKISFKNRKVEPDDEVKGTVARAYLYFNQHYKMKLSKQQRKLFMSWNEEFPPKQWEIDWDMKIFKIQGNHNSFISEWKKN